MSRERSCDQQKVRIGVVGVGIGAYDIQGDTFYTQLMGTEGGATMDPLRIHTEMRGASVDITPECPKEGGHINEIIHFVDCLTKGTELISTAEHGPEVARILDAIYKSAEQGREIRLN